LGPERKSFGGTVRLEADAAEVFLAADISSKTKR